MSTGKEQQDMVVRVCCIEWGLVKDARVVGLQ